MKVFKVVTEHDKDKEIITTEQFVSSPDFKTVSEYFIRHCEEYEEELISVSYQVTIVQNIEPPKD